VTRTDGGIFRDIGRRRDLGEPGVRFQAGGASFLDVLDADRTLVQTQTDLAASETALVSDQITVFKALGGGWEDSPAVKPPSAG
jgi:outer membrane protein TolC